MCGWSTRDNSPEKAISLWHGCILLLSFISTALTPLEKQKLICNRPEKCKETSARDSKPEFDPSFYIEGQTEEPILTGLFLRRKLALVAGPWDELSVSIPAMVGTWRKDFVILILQFVHFPKYMFSFWRLVNQRLRTVIVMIVTEK